jgi:hypothetical protein
LHGVGVGDQEPGSDDHQLTRRESERASGQTSPATSGAKSIQPPSEGAVNTDGELLPWALERTRGGGVQYAEAALDIADAVAWTASPGDSSTRAKLKLRVCLVCTCAGAA